MTDRVFWAIMVAAGVVIVAALYAVTSGVHVVTSDGDRVGVVTKLSRRGLIFKTWEGEANVGSSDVPGVGSVWAFTVVDDGPIKDIQQAMKDGRKVRLSYVEYFSGGIVNGDTSYRITSVVDMKKE